MSRVGDSWRRSKSEGMAERRCGVFLVAPHVIINTYSLILTIEFAWVIIPGRLLVCCLFCQ